MWRLVLDHCGNFNAANYDYVFNYMTPQEIQEANIAVDMAQDAIKKSLKRGR